jgi:HD-GYP domain-containing protein (c-di-GMP phosphodiesterase class II)
MQKNNMSSIIVKDRKNKISGIFTLRDFLKLDYVNCLKGTIISEVMTTNLITISSDESYTEAIDLMYRHSIGHIPVVDGSQAVGIVSLRDLLTHYQQNLEDILHGTISALSTAISKRDPYTAYHQTRVAKLSTAIGNVLGFSKKRLDGLNIAATVHDVGKINIPTGILNKPGKLLPEEFTLIKIHPVVGFDILMDVEFPWPIGQMVYQHHERIDGSGYPQGLNDGEILLEAKIIGVSDVVEAMASHRPYRPALGIEVALEEINSKKSEQYAPEVVDACSNLFREGFVFN